MNYTKICLGNLFTSYLRAFFLLLILSCFCSNLFAQDAYLMSISNPEKINQYTYEFDVLLNSTGDNFELTSYQAALSFNSNLAGSGSLTFTYVDNSSDLNNAPSIGIGVNNADGNNELTFASFPGSDMISAAVSKIGRFRVETSESLDADPSVNWNFSGNITTILTGAGFADITNPSNFVSDIAGATQLMVAAVTASGTPDEGTAPEKTIDGLGYNDGDPLSRWATKPLPQWISYDLGSLQTVSTVKVSFFKFDENRIYEYSIKVSVDNINWTEVLHSNSAPEEWTVAEFSPVEARYVKLDLISSTNNDAGWANIWETEIYKSGQTTGVETDRTQPDNFQLLQNYPNPFNPSTKIAFNLQQDAKTRLTVYNVIGEKVADLVDDFLSAGRHEIAFNGDKLASGIYLYKIEVDNQFTDIKKMILMK